MHVLRDLTGMIGATFEVPGDHDIVGAAGDVPRVLHHVGDALAEDRVAESELFFRTARRRRTDQSSSKSTN